MGRYSSAGNHPHVSIGKQRFHTSVPNNGYRSDVPAPGGHRSYRCQLTYDTEDRSTLGQARRTCHDRSHSHDRTSWHHHSLGMVWCSLTFSLSAGIWSNKILRHLFPTVTLMQKVINSTSEELQGGEGTGYKSVERIFDWIILMERHPQINRHHFHNFIQKTFDEVWQ